jgi:PHD/YefM family antitoxin component YafN of YafNO toxin-antitoxin module
MKRAMMKTISLINFNGDWRAVAAAVEADQEAIALMIGKQTVGVLVPQADLARIMLRYEVSALQQAQSNVTAPMAELHTYLDLLRDDPTLVPSEDGQPLEFMTMMNSSYLETEQFYQFRHPQTHATYTYRTSELQQKLGRTFMSVDLIPPNPKAYVENRIHHYE